MLKWLNLKNIHNCLECSISICMRTQSSQEPIHRLHFGKLDPRIFRWCMARTNQNHKKTITFKLKFSIQAALAWAF